MEMGTILILLFIVIGTVLIIAKWKSVEAKSEKEKSTTETGEQTENKVTSFNEEYEKEMEDVKKGNKLNEDVHQIAQDVRFFRNLVIILIILEIIAAIVFIANMKP